MISRDDYRQMLLAGTVSFPATFPQVGRISIHHQRLPECDGDEVAIVTVTEKPSIRVTLSRKVLAKSIRAIFLPRDQRHNHSDHGLWLLGNEIVPYLTRHLNEKRESLYGIVYIPEHAPSLLQVHAGMTAAESVQYYPPLPGDPSHNHYNAWPSASKSWAAASCFAKSCLVGVECEEALSCRIIEDGCESLFLSCATIDDETVAACAQAQDDDKFEPFSSEDDPFQYDFLKSC